MVRFRFAPDILQIDQLINSRMFQNMMTPACSRNNEAECPCQIDELVKPNIPGIPKNLLQPSSFVQFRNSCRHEFVIALGVDPITARVVYQKRTESVIHSPYNMFKPLLRRSSLK